MPGKTANWHHSYLQYAVYKRQIQSQYRGKFVVSKLGTFVVGKLGEFVVGKLWKLAIRLFVCFVALRPTQQLWS